MPPEKNEKKIEDVAGAVKELSKFIGRKLGLLKSDLEKRSETISSLVDEAEARTDKTLTSRIVTEEDERVAGGPIRYEDYSIKSLDGGKRCRIEFVRYHKGIIEGSAQWTSYEMVKKGKIWKVEATRTGLGKSENFKYNEAKDAPRPEKTSEQIIEQVRKGPIQNNTVQEVGVMGTGEPILGGNETTPGITQSPAEVAAYDKEIDSILKQKYGNKDVSGITGKIGNGEEIKCSVTHVLLGFTIEVVRVSSIKKDQGKKSEHTLETTYRTRHEIQKNPEWNLRSSSSAVTVKIQNGQEVGRSYPTPQVAGSIPDVISALKNYTR